MSKQKLTPWFDGAKQKPWEPGVYQQESAPGIGYQYWDGALWYGWEFTPESALLQYRRRSPAHRFYQNDPWRGLASPSTERKRG